MLPFMLLFVLIIFVVTLGMFYAARWAGDRIQATLVERLQAGESIVNNAQVPDTWLAPYRSRIAALRQAGKSEQEIARVGTAAQTQCLKKLDDLIEFFDKRRVTATPDAQRALMSTLRAERRRWASASWQEFVGGELPQRTPQA